MLEEAVRHYNELLNDEAVAADSLAMLTAELEAAKLIFGGRPLSPYLRPHFVIREDWERVVRACETVFGALQKVKEAAIKDDALLDELGVTAIERELIAIDPGYAHVSPTARLDSFLVGDTYSYVELNGESPAGIAFADSASKIFQKLPVMKRFAERYDLTPMEGSSKLLATLVECYEEFIGKKITAKPKIAIVDLRDLPTIKEFELFRDFFEANGYPSLICSPDELEFDGKRLSARGREIDIVYKRLLVNEYLPIIESEPILLEACRAKAVCMVNSFRGKLVHKKAIFAVLTNERYEHLFDADELAVIRAHVPWTRRFRDEETRYADADISLVQWTRENSHKLVLKPNDDYGGHGIYIGWNSTAEEWNSAIETALSDGDYLVQERVKTAKENFPMVMADGGWQMAEQLVDLDPLLFMGKVGSAFTRLASNELANVTAGGGMVPTFIISKK
ncbi:MAG: hypothetical protein K1X52_02185 [Pyrinomonadaceae bacterium]|nr:hypothetical protein [Pyrinomonadaceae bacterium]